MTVADLDTLVEELERAVTGPVLTPADAGFADEVATFDLAVRYRPRIAVGAASVDDVAAVLAVAEQHGLQVAVLGSGHAPVGPEAADLVLSLRRMADVAVDPEARTATVGPGTTWGDVLAAATPSGLAPLCGSAPGVGVIGLLLGGGMGPVARTFGFSADHVRAFQLVTGGGEVRNVDATGDPELFWALRGGRGGLGVVTAATVDLMPLATIYGGGLFFGEDDAAAVLRGYSDWVDADPVPEGLTTSVAMIRYPPVEELPELLRGRFVVHLRVAFVGSASDGERLVAPLRALGTPFLDTVTEMPYAHIGTIHNDPVDPVTVSTGGLLLRSFDREAADTLLAAAGPGVPVPLSLVELRHMGGALARPAVPANAVGGRDAAMGVWVISAPLPAASPTVLAAAAVPVRGVLDALRPWSSGGTQINFFGSVNTPEEYEGSWPVEVRARLGTLRRSTMGDRMPILGPVTAELR